MLESLLTESEGVFPSIVKILKEDPALCNYLRYMEYGNITSSVGRYHWESKKDPVANAYNDLNNTQLIRFLPAFTEKSITAIRTMVEDEPDYRTENFIGFVKELGPFSDPNSSPRDYTYYAEHLLDLTINLDHTFKCLGKAYTILDFIGKNRNPIDGEFGRMTGLYRNVDNYFVVGDQCFLLALLMHNGVTYVDTKVMTSIWKRSPDSFKTVLKNLVLFVMKHTMDTTNMSISQMLDDHVTSPIIRTLQNRGSFQGIDIGSVSKSRSILSFSSNAETDSQIVNTIEDVISKCVFSYLNSRWKLDKFGNTSLPTMIRQVREGIQGYYRENSRSSYERGFKIGRIVESCGWRILDDVDRANVSSISFSPDGCYIYKDVNIYPKDAVLYGDHAVLHKVLKDNAVEDFNRAYGIVIYTLYIDVYTGKMYARGSHPNVSNGGVVCMGDIAGKISFADAQTEDIPKMLAKCEDLLKSINYTSSYTDRGISYFTNDSKSERYMDSNSVKIGKEELTDIVEATDDTYSDISEEDTQTVTSDDTDVVDTADDEFIDV